MEAARLGLRYRIHGLARDLDELELVDPAPLLEEAEREQADGVVGTKDRSALVAALVAARRGLPGPAPRAVLSCQHKPTSRRVQRETVPEAVPRFALLGDDLPFRPPFVAKPVVGRLSHGTVTVESPDQVPRPAQDAYARSFEALAALAGERGLAFEGYLAEELISGAEVTLEGYVYRGTVKTVGITDSVFYPGTNSFERFEYPSHLPADRWEELSGVAERLMPAYGFDGGFFNIEFRVPERGPAKIIEVNARIASQFAPLVQRLHGRSTYDALFALACGDDPVWEPPPARGVAVSYVVRVFEDVLVEAVPQPEEGLELLVQPGAKLSQQGVNDTSSYRLAIFVETAPTREEAVERCRRRAAALRFELSAAR